LCEPISLIVPPAPDGPVDMTARIVANELSKVLDQRVIRILNAAMIFF
jgi:tripartite-type tricarboxylate transporter receptor subunit TctC